MLITEYLLLLIPGLVLATILFLLLRRTHPLLHLFLFITVFIFTRDAMTPLGLWSIGNGSFLWIRFIHDPVTLLILGLSSLGFVFLMQSISPELAVLVEWFEGNRVAGILTGIAGAVIAVLPLALIYRGVPLENRGGTVPLRLLPFILFIALSGNLYEEILFRGYLYGWLTERERIKPVPAGLISGLFFSFGHVFLAFNVTDVGISILVFALWEGCLAGLVRSRFGLIPAVLTHGLAVFLLTSGLL
ncbi:MAG: CPBP family intramembrane glutamic endopeptidase [Anaerolineales bacterium]